MATLNQFTVQPILLVGHPIIYSSRSRTLPSLDAAPHWSHDSSVAVLELHVACAEAAATSLLSNPKTANLIQQIVAGQQPRAEASGNNGTSGNGSLMAQAEEQQGQLVEVKFKAVKPGKYSLQLQCMSGGCRDQTQFGNRTMAERCSTPVLPYWMSDC